jgi:hypothetical protein
MFEDRLPKFARANIETRLHIVCCEHMRLTDFDEHIDSLCEVMLAKVHDLMMYDWKCVSLFPGLAVTVKKAYPLLYARFTSPHTELAEFLNSLAPAVRHVPPSDDSFTD